MTVFWVAAPCSLVEIYHHHDIALMMEAAITSENVGKLLADYTAQQPKRYSSSHSPP
jgi:hypothetical protein